MPARVQWDHMDFKSNKFALVILAFTASSISRFMFYLFDDTEGPNLLIVLVFSSFVFGVSLAAYFYVLNTFSQITRILLTVGLQALVVGVLYFLLS